MYAEATAGEVRKVMLFGVTGKLLLPTIHSCCRASLGVIRLAGSHLKQRSIKSMNATSWHFNTWNNDFVPGILFLPLELATMRGFPNESTEIPH